MSFLFSLLLGDIVESGYNQPGCSDVFSGNLVHVQLHILTGGC